MSQATVTISSPLTPESGTMLALGLPRLLAIRADGAPVVARVEDVCGLDHLLLGRGEAAENRLGHDRVVGRLAPRVEERGDAALAAAALVGNGRGRRAPLPDPAVVERELLAQRAHVDELVAARREADRPLAGQERSLADRADALHGVACELSHTEGP